MKTTIGKKALSLLLCLVMLLSLLPAGMIQTSANAADTVAYPVEGGNIYFDPSTGTITDCDYTVTSAVIPGTINGIPVTTIGYKAFYDCYNLTSVTIGDSVTAIGNSAFYKCKKLTSVTIGNSVTTIGNSAFSYCSGLTSVTIPNSVTTIGGSAFAHCSSLTSVTIGDSVTTIGNYAFEDCSGLTSVTIGDSVTTIGDWAFSHCSELTSVTIGDRVTTIGKEAFYFCESLTSVTIPDSVTTIGNGAFHKCSSLTSATIGNSVTTIGDRAFYWCSGLTSVTIGDSVTTIGESAFYDCSGLTSVTIPNSVTTIGDRAFYQCSGLTSVTIPNSVTTIGEGAFYDCSGLTSVTIGDSVTSIGDYAFCYCSSLTSVTIPNSVTTMGNGTFAECDRLTSVTIGDRVTTIGNSAFSWCESLTSVTIPNSVTTIGDSAFYHCSGLTSVTIGDRVTTIGESAFKWCESLTSVTIPNSVTTIGDYAFSHCSSLTSVIIPDSVTTIGYWAFSGCKSLTSVVVLNPDCAIYNSSSTLGSASITVIYGHENSAAQIYATTNCYTFVTLVGHSAGNLLHKWTCVATIAPTCTESGENLYTCFICGDTKREPVYALGHDYCDGICSRCGDSNVKTLTLSYDSQIKDVGIRTENYEYSDSYFDADATTYNHKLATVSLGMAMSAVTFKDKGDTYIRDTLEQIGCDEDSIYTVRFDNNKSLEDNCAYAFGVKYLEDTDTYLIPVAIRGVGYDKEWISNFHVVESGYSKYAAGFKKAADGVYTDLMKYIGGLDKSKIKIWVTGFSRAGAISNLLGGRLTEKSGISKGNIYVYTFATPQGVKKGTAKAYENIHNIVSEVDIVPRLALSSWDFTRYGITHYLPCQTKRGTKYGSLVSKMLTEYDKIVKNAGATDSISILPGQELALDLILDYADDLVASVEVYDQMGYQQLIMDFKASVYADKEEYAILYYLLQGDEKLVKAFTNIFERTQLGTPVVNLQSLQTIVKNIEQLGNLGTSAVNILCTLCDFYLGLGSAALKSVINDDALTTYTKAGVLLADAVKDGTRSMLFRQHWGETYLAWMRAGTPEELFRTTSYKRVSVKCPVDITVYDSKNRVVARVVDDVVDTSLTESLYVAVNEFGEKEIYMPDDDNYRVVVTARENGTLDIVTNTYDAEGVLQNSECYLDLTMVEDQTFYVESEMDDPTPTVETNDTTLTAHVSCTETPEKVTVTIPEKEGCTIFGAGEYDVGDTVTLMIAMDEGYGFDGWYSAGKLISEEEVYNFTITESATYEPRIHKIQEDTPITNPFVDVKERDYFYTPVLWAVDKGITNGMGKGKFAPENPCTRGQIVTFLWRACGSPEPMEQSNPFSDVSTSAYYYKAVLWAVENGITNGTGKGKFSPDDTCTRGQVATFLWRAQGKPTPTSSANPFNDVSSKTYYYDAVLWAVEKGVTNGTGKGRFSPDDNCTRGQIVTFLYRALAEG